MSARAMAATSAIAAFNALYSASISGVGDAEAWKAARTTMAADGAAARRARRMIPSRRAMPAISAGARAITQARSPVNVVVVSPGQA